MQEDALETIENTEEHDSDSVAKGGKVAPDQIRRAIS
jgi:hypothetical protein